MSRLQTSNDSRDTPIGQVARIALQTRFLAVFEYMPLAAGSFQEDPEYVHRLRVGSRRTVAALDLFEHLLPPRRALRMRRALTRLRRTANLARDLDVLGERLHTVAEERDSKALHAAVQQILQRRLKAQPALRAACRRSHRAELQEESRRLIRKTRWRLATPEPCLEVAGRELLRAPISRFLHAANSELNTDTALHQLRIRGKQLRYALELMDGAFESDTLRELQRQFEKIQKQLGVINDHATAQRLILAWAKKSHGKSGRLLRKLAEREAEALSRKSQDFRRVWTEGRLAQVTHGFESLLDDRDPDDKTKPAQSHGNGASRPSGAIEAV